jgi:hypothetical protein
MKLRICRAENKSRTGPPRIPCNIVTHDAAKSFTNQHAVVSGEINGLRFESMPCCARPARSFTIARSTNANTSLDGRQGSSRIFSEQTQTCSANVVRICDGRPQFRRQRSLWRSADSSPLRPRIAHAGLHSFLNKSSLELGQGADYLEHQPVLG